MNAMNPARAEAANPRPIATIGPIEAATEVVLAALGEDVRRAGLVDTPHRVARSLRALTAGYEQTVADVVGDAVFEEVSRGPVLVRDIELYSLCEHHMLPFHGVAHIAYLPAGRVIGLSKLPRIVDVFARRLQVQERLTREVADAIEAVLSPRGVAVVIEASHFCMMMRGVQKQRSRTMTVEYRGAYETDPSRQAELMSLLRGT